MSLKTSRVLLGVLTVIALTLGGSATAASAAEYRASSVSFDDGEFGGWTPFGTSAASLSTVDDGSGGRFARVTGRSTDYAGLVSPAGLLRAGSTYSLSMRVRLAAGTPDTRARFVVQPGFAWVGDTPVKAGVWTTVTGTVTVPTSASSPTVYIGTQDAGGAFDYDVDDLRVLTRTSLAAIAPFPVGVAVDQRETAGSAAAVVKEDFSQITAENDMKPDAWYDSARTLRMSSSAVSLMNFARDSSLRVYGHTLVWHAQTPAWFFQDGTGRSLTSTDADKQVLRDRLRAHIFGVAQQMSTRYGAFGAGNPLVAFDVVNEVIDDGGTYADGLRRSPWYTVLGEEYIDLAFRYADQAFNSVYAAPGANRPIALVVNDYGTEWDAKRARLKALVSRLLDRGVPVDAVGHQFHVGIDRPVATLEAAITDFRSLPIRQAVTELDATTGTVTTERLRQQGTFYRDAFAAFARNADKIFSVSVWGLNDGRSWVRAQGAPLLFDDTYAPKPAYDGAIRALLPVPPTTTSAPLTPLSVSASASTRCASGRITVAVTVRNGETVPLHVTLSGASVVKARDFDGGTAALVLLNTRAPTIAEGTVAITATGTVAGKQETTSFSVPYPAKSCV